MKFVDNIFTIKNVLTHDECQAYIALTEQAGYDARRSEVLMLG